MDPHRLEVAASVPFADVPAISPGAVARGDLRSLAGNSKGGLTRRRRRPGHRHRADAAAVTGPTRFAIGTPVQVQIDLEVHKDAVLVPSAAIVRDGAEAAVFVAVGDKATAASSRRASTTALTWRSLKGIKAGETVITHGQNGLPDGAKITTAGPAKSGEGAQDK